MNENEHSIGLEPDAVPIDSEKPQRGKIRGPYRKRKNVTGESKAEETEKISQKLIEPESLKRTVAAILDGVNSVLPESRFERRSVSEREANAVSLPLTVATAQASDETVAKVMRYAPLALVAVGFGIFFLSRLRKNANAGTGVDIRQSGERENHTQPENL